MSPFCFVSLVLALAAPTRCILTFEMTKWFCVSQRALSDTTIIDTVLCNTIDGCCTSSTYHENTCMTLLVANMKSIRRHDKESRHIIKSPTITRVFSHTVYIRHTALFQSLRISPPSVDADRQCRKPSMLRRVQGQHTGHSGVRAFRFTCDVHSPTCSKCKSSP